MAEIFEIKVSYVKITEYGLEKQNGVVLSSLQLVQLTTQ